MKKRFTEEQIVKAETRMVNGTPGKDLAIELGVSVHTLYAWKKKYKGMNISDAKRLRDLEQENSKLKKLVADLSLDNLMLKDVADAKKKIEKWRVHYSEERPHTSIGFLTPNKFEEELENNLLALCG